MHWGLSYEMDMVRQVQILIEAVCISLCTNALKNSMNLYLLLPALSK